MYLVLIVTSVIVAVCSYRMFLSKITKRVNPQISRAMVQISRRLPELEKNEQALRDVYDQMMESRKELVDGKYHLNRHYDIALEDVEDYEDLEDLVDYTLSWTNTATQIMVGGLGYVMAVDDEDTIIAHHLCTERDRDPLRASGGPSSTGKRSGACDQRDLDAGGEERLRKEKAPTPSALSLCPGCVINDVPAASDPAVSVRNRIAPQKKHWLHPCHPSGSEQSLRW